MTTWWKGAETSSKPVHPITGARLSGADVRSPSAHNLELAIAVSYKVFAALCCHLNREVFVWDGSVCLRSLVRLYQWFSEEAITPSGGLEVPRVGRLVLGGGRAMSKLRAVCLSSSSGGSVW